MVYLAIRQCSDSIKLLNAYMTYCGEIVVKRRTLDHMYAQIVSRSSDMITLCNKSSEICHSKNMA